MKIVNGVAETDGYSARQVARRAPARKAPHGPVSHAKTTPADSVAEVPRCQNPACIKPLMNRRKDTKFCSPSCRNAVKRAEAEDAPEQWISQACKYPTQQQAELTRRDMKHRHPYGGKRPHKYSGYCVISTCECKCHPWNEPEEEDEA